MPIMFVGKLPVMVKLLSLILAFFLAFASFFPVRTLGQTPTPAPEGTIKESIKSKPSVVTFFRTGEESALSSEIRFDLTEIPKNAILEKSTFSFVQEGTSFGILKILDRTNGEILDSLALGNEEKKTSKRIATLATKWIADPEINFGLILQTSDLELDNEVILKSIKLDLEFKIPDTTSPEITRLELQTINSNTINILWATNEDSLVVANYGKTSNYDQGSPKSNSYAKQGNILISGLSNNITYHLQFVAEDKAGNQVKSNDLVFATSDEPVPNQVVDTTGVLPPKLLNLEQGSTTEGFKVDLAWSKSDSEILEGYIIYRNEFDEPYAELARVNSDVLRYTDTKVEPGKNYSYFVVSYLAAEESSRSPIVVTSIPDVNVLGLSDILTTGNKSLAIFLIFSGVLILFSAMYFLRKRIQENIAYNEKLTRHSRLHNYLHDPDYYVNGYEDKIMEKHKE